SRGCLLRRRFRGFGLHDVDAALEIRAIFDDDAGRANVPHQFGVLTDLDPLGGFYVALDCAEGYDFARLDRGVQNPVRPDRDLGPRSFHVPRGFLFTFEFLFVENLADDFDGFADPGGPASVIRLESSLWHAGHRRALLSRLNGTGGYGRRTGDRARRGVGL